MIVDAYEYVGEMERLSWLSGVYWPHRCYGPYVAHCNSGRMVYFETDKGNGGEVGYEWSHSRDAFKGNRIGTFNTETGELTLDEKKFDGVPGVPDGWRLVRIGAPKKGEYFVDCFGNAVRCPITTESKGFVIVERIAPRVEVGKWYLMRVGCVVKVNNVGDGCFISKCGLPFKFDDVVNEVQVTGVPQ